MTTSLDSAGYQARQDAHVTIRLQNSGFESNVNVEVWVEDELGYPVLLLDTLREDLPYGSDRSVTLNWNTGVTYAGNYRVRSSLLAEAGAQIEKIVPFAILPEIAVDAFAVTDRAHYPAQADVLISLDVSNGGRTISSRNWR